MQKSTLIVSILALVAVVAGAIFFFQKDAVKEAEDTGSVSFNTAQAEEVERRVIEFGTKLKNVSLLAPKAQVEAAMDAQYGPYVSADLLVEWKNDPENALGRSTSSPWPERIEVVEIEEKSDTEYAVEGNIIEVTSQETAQGGGVAAVQPVSLQVKLVNNAWVITAAEKGAYSELPERVTVRGEYTCLPHKDTSGPITLECALGIKAENGVFYALNTQLMSTMLPQMQTGTRIEVEGVLTPVEMLSSVQKYDIKGVLNATVIRKI